MRLFLCLAAIFAATQLCCCKTYGKCELALELQNKFGFTREEVKKWVCIAEYESTFNSSAINHYNWDESKDFGLFQLNSRYWCGNETSINACKKKCEDFLDDDITDDVKCARKIKKDTERWMKTDDGLVAWVAYKLRCQNRDLNAYISECLTLLNTREEFTTTAQTTLAPTTTTTTTTKPTTTTTKPTTTTTKPTTTTTNEPTTTTTNKPSTTKKTPVRGPQIQLTNTDSFYQIEASEANKQTQRPHWSPLLSHPFMASVPVKVEEPMPSFNPSSITRNQIEPLPNSYEPAKLYSEFHPTPLPTTSAMGIKFILFRRPMPYPFWTDQQMFSNNFFPYMPNRSPFRNYREPYYYK